jgi:hypothetical protein
MTQTHKRLEATHFMCVYNTYTGKVFPIDGDIINFAIKWTSLLFIWKIKFKTNQL